MVQKEEGSPGIAESSKGLLAAVQMSSEVEEIDNNLAWFPEQARILCLLGADVIAMPAALVNTPYNSKRAPTIWRIILS